MFASYILEQRENIYRIKLEGLLSLRRKIDDDVIFSQEMIEWDGLRG